MSAAKQYSPKAAPQPTSIPTCYANVPRELIERPQWVAWIAIPQSNGKKPRKLPINPHTGKAAETDNPATWGTFAQAIARCQRSRLSGVGIVLTAGDPFTGIDLDNCRDPETGKLSDHAQTTIDALKSYTEVSPSDTGIHIFVFGKLPPIGRKQKGVKSYEAYEAGQYLTVTGDHLAGTPKTIEPRQSELIAWHVSVWGLNQMNPLAGVELDGEHAIPPAGGNSVFSPSISLRERFQNVSWTDGLVYAVLERDRDVQRAIVSRLGRDSGLADEVFTHPNRLSRRFACLFHEEGRPDRPSADLSDYAGTGKIKYRCHHRGEGGLRSHEIGLIDCFAWQQTSAYRNLTRAELKLWTLRLFIDMGLIDAPEVERRSLPDELPVDAPEALRVIYHGIVERMRIQALLGGGPVALTHKFLAHWWGVSEHAVAKCMQWLLKHFYLKGGVFLRKDGTLSNARETERSPECFVMKLEAKAWKPRGKTFIQRTRAEWAEYYAERREMDNAEAIYWHQYEEAERRGDFDDLDNWDPDAPEPNCDNEEALAMGDEPLDPEILSIMETMEGEVIL